MGPWDPVSHTSTFKHAQPTMAAFPSASHHWEDLERLISTGKVYEQVLEGEAVRKDRNHVVLHGGTVADETLPEIKQKAELYDLSGMAESGMTKVKMCAVDALYKKEYKVVAELNAFLEEHPFGPYQHVSDAFYEVARLRKKKKNDKADELSDLLKKFAVSRKCSPEAFSEWPVLMDLKRKRDAYAHPFDEKYLVAEMHKENADLSPIMNALTLLLKC